MSGWRGQLSLLDVEPADIEPADIGPVDVVEVVEVRARPAGPAPRSGRAAPDVLAAWAERTVDAALPATGPDPGAGAGGGAGGDFADGGSDAAARALVVGALDRTLFVSAGAGSGKTTALVGRIVALVASGRARAGDLAAITFTEKAATELRVRVAAELAAGAAEAGRPEVERARLAQASTDLDEATISTLHGFAHRILSEHPLEAGLPPIVDVLGDVEARLAFDGAWRAHLDELLDRHDLEDVLARSTCLGIRLGHLGELAWQLHEHWDRLDDAFLEAPLDTTIRARVDGRAVAAALSAVVAQRTAALDPDDRMAVHLAELAPYAEAWCAAADEGDELTLLELTADAPPIAAGRKGQAKTWPRIDLDGLRTRLAEIHADRDRLAQAALDEVLTILLAELGAWTLREAARRRRTGRLHFHDLLVGATRLVRSDPAVRSTLRARWSHLLVDEFQDTDPLQLELAVLLASEGDADAPAGPVVAPGRLFVVGDAQQSIYRFRRADIRQFLSTPERIGAETVRLTRNFRSAPGVLAWINDVFGALIGVGVPGAQAPFQALDPGRAASVAAAAPDAVAGLVAAGDEPGGPCVVVLGRPHDDVATADMRAVEASEIAAWIAATVAADGLRHADVAVLLPTRTALPALETALEAADVPYRVESRSLVWATEEISELLAVLRAVDDPADEVALLAALRTPAFGCGDDDLVDWVRLGGRFREGRRIAPDGAADHPVVRALALLEELRSHRWWDDVSTLVERTIRTLRLTEQALVHRRPRDHWRRLQFVVDEARRFAAAARSAGEPGGARLLRPFLGWAEEQRDERVRVPDSGLADPEDDAVRILTIHAAKGLEFPVVVLAGLNTDLGRRAPGPQIVWDEHDEAQVRISKAVGATSGWERSADHEKAMDEHEQLRLLYVGATRACERLLVSTHRLTRDRSSHAARLADLVGRLDEPGLVADTWPPTLEGPAAPAGDAEPAPSPIGPIGQIPSAPPSGPAAPTADIGADDGEGARARRDEWEARRAAVLATAEAPVRSATALGALVRGIAQPPPPTIAAAAGPALTAPSPAAVSDPRAAGPAAVVDPRPAAARPAPAAPSPSPAPAAPTPAPAAMAPAPAAIEVGAGVDLDVGAGPRWLRPPGEAATAFGRAVHGALQDVALPDAADREVVAERHARAEGVSERAADVARCVAAALASPTVAGIVAGGRFWREVYVGAPIDGTLVEGFVDLLGETDEGLVVVDYKTDVGDPDVLLARYAGQLAAYAVAVGSAVGRPVGRALLVCCGRPGDAEERSVPDLPAAMAAIHTALT